MGQTCYPSKSQVFKRCSFIFFNSTCSNSDPYDLHQTSLPTLQSILIFLFHPLLVHKTILTISTSIAFLYISPFFHIPIFTYSHPYNLNQNPFPYLNHSSNLVCFKWQRTRESCEDWYFPCSDLFLVSRSMGNE